MEMMKAETATSKSVRAHACAPLLCPLPGELRMMGALALGSNPAGLASLQGPGPQRAALGKGTQAVGLRGWGLLWLCRGDSDTGTLVGRGVHTEEPPTFCLESQPLSPSPTGLSCCPFASHPRAFARAAPHVLHICSRLPPPISPSLPVTKPLSPVTVSPITLWPGGDSASVHGASWHRVGMGVRFPLTASRAEGMGVR